VLHAQGGRPPRGGFRPAPGVSGPAVTGPGATTGPGQGVASWRAAVDGAARLLAEAGVPSPHVDAHALAAHTLGTDRLVLPMAPAPTPEALARFAGLVDRRRRREPL